MNLLEGSVGSLKICLSRKVNTSDSVKDLQRSFQKLREEMITGKEWPTSDIPKLIKLIREIYRVSIIVALGCKGKNYNEEANFETSLRTRIICCELLHLLINYLNTHDNLLQRIGSTKLYLNAFDILVVTTRMCLDIGTKYVNFAKKASEETRLILANSMVSDNKHLLFLYFLNDLELLNYQPQGHTSPETIKQRLDNLLSVDVPEYHLKYQEYIKYIMLKLAVRLLKVKEAVQWMYQYLPDKELLVIKGLYSIENFDYKEAAYIAGITSGYYQLYLEVRQNGFKNISDTSLKDTITNNWDSKGFFEILAEKYQECIGPLKLWFSIYNDVPSKPGDMGMYHNALMFFVSVVDYVIQGVIKIPLLEVLELVKVVSDSLMNTRKSCQLPSGLVLNKIVTLIRQVIIEGDMNDQMAILLFEDTKRVIDKHGFKELLRDLSGILIFYLMSVNSPSLAKYYTYYTKHHTEDNELKRVLSIAYQSNQSQSLLAPAVQLIREHPQYVYLFLRNKGLGTLLFVSNQALNSLPNVFCIFAQVLQSSYQVGQVSQRLLDYIQQCNVNMSQQVEQHLETLCSSLVEKSKSQVLGPYTIHRLLLVAFFCRVFILSKKFSLVQKSTNQNRYYKTSLCLQQLVKRNELVPSLYQLGNAVLSTGLNKTVIRHHEALGADVFEVGEFHFYQLIQNLLMSKYNPTESKTLKMIMFHLRALKGDSLALQAQIKKEDDIDILNLYNVCQYISKEVRIQLVRKLIFLGLSMGKQCTINMDNLKTVILYSGDIEERVLCARQMVMLYSEQGKEFLEMIVDRFPEVRNVILQIPQ